MQSSVAVCEMCGRSVSGRELTFSAEGKQRCRTCAAGAEIRQANVNIGLERGRTQTTLAALGVGLTFLLLFLAKFAPNFLLGVWIAVMVGSYFVFRTHVLPGA